MLVALLMSCYFKFLRNVSSFQVSLSPLEAGIKPSAMSWHIFDRVHDSLYMSRNEFLRIFPRLTGRKTIATLEYERMQERPEDYLKERRQKQKMAFVTTCVDEPSGGEELGCMIEEFTRNMVVADLMAACEQTIGFVFVSGGRENERERERNEKGRDKRERDTHT